MLTPLPFTERNLILTGYTGPNQPVIGRQLAERLHMPFVNIDMDIEERSHMSVDDLRARFGEARLKTIEAEIMQEAMLRRSALIRINGRTLQNGDYLTRLQETGLVICIVASLDAVLQRLHLSLGARYHSPHERAFALGHLRSEWAVRHLPGVHELDVTNLDEAQTVESIIALWHERAVQRG